MGAAAGDPERTAQAGRLVSSASFKALARKVEAEYRAKGYSLNRAREIGAATAGKVANEKHGKG